jgi:hypothetical protein
LIGATPRVVLAAPPPLAPPFFALPPALRLTLLPPPPASPQLAPPLVPPTLAPSLAPPLLVPRIAQPLAMPLPPLALLPLASPAVTPLASPHAPAIVTSFSATRKPSSVFVDAPNFVYFEMDAYVRTYFRKLMLMLKYKQDSTIIAQHGDQLSKLGDPANLCGRYLHLLSKPGDPANLCGHSLHLLSKPGDPANLCGHYIHLLSKPGEPANLCGHSIHLLSWISFLPPGQEQSVSKSFIEWGAKNYGQACWLCKVLDRGAAKLHSFLCKFSVKFKKSSEIYFLICICSGSAVPTIMGRACEELETIKFLLKYSVKFKYQNCITIGNIRVPVQGQGHPPSTERGVTNSNKELSSGVKDIVTRNITIIFESHRLVSVSVCDVMSQKIMTHFSVFDVMSQMMTHFPWKSRGITSPVQSSSALARIGQHAKYYFKMMMKHLFPVEVSRSKLPMSAYLTSVLTMSAYLTSARILQVEYASFHVIHILQVAYVSLPDITILYSATVGFEQSSLHTWFCTEEQVHLWRICQRQPFGALFGQV